MKFFIFLWACNLIVWTGLFIKIWITEHSEDAVCIVMSIMSFVFLALGILMLIF